MRPYHRIALAALLLPGALAAQAAPPAHGTAAISPADIKERIAFLASDALRGRDTPSPGLDLAAEYAAAEFQRFGLQPAGENGGYIQRYAFQKPLLDASAVAVKVGAATPAYSRDFFLVPGATDSVAAPALYIGRAKPGMTAPAAVAGKTMVVTIDETLLDQEAWQNSLMGAMMAGMSSNAAAIVVVLDTTFNAAMVPMIASMTATQEAPMPLLGITHRAFTAAAGQDFARLRQAELMEPVPLEAPIMVRSASGRASSLVPNVVGILPGSDPVLKDEYVVFSAHIDHVGVGAPDATGDSIFNGADDDASGTSAILEVAQKFAADATRPKRSLVFLLVSGEEKGLLGSKHWAEHPTVPLAQLVANINIDMIGRNNPDTVVAIGQEYTDLGTTVQQVATQHAADLKLTVAPDLWPEEQLFFRSDHFSFASKGVPAIFFTTGLHEDYHKQSDEPETIDNDKLARVARLVYNLGATVANAAQKPQWTEAGRAAVKFEQ